MIPAGTWNNLVMLLKVLAYQPHLIRLLDLHFLVGTHEKINEYHRTGDSCVFPSIYHSTGQCMGRIWEIGTHHFPIRYPSYGIPHHMENAGVSPPISNSTTKRIARG